jgi:hypothetical protein
LTINGYMFIIYYIEIPLTTISYDAIRFYLNGQTAAEYEWKVDNCRYQTTYFSNESEREEIQI